MYATMGEPLLLIDPVKLAVDRIRAAQRKPLEDAARQYEAEQREQVYAVLRGDPYVDPVMAGAATALPDIQVETFPWWLVAIGVGLVLALMHGPKGGDW